MHALNYTLEKHILQADGRYLDAQELYPLEEYIQTYTTRLQAYQDIRDNSEKLVIQSLRRMAQTHPEMIQQHGQRCKYDMSEVLRYVALAMLRNDETLFKEQLVFWLDTILLSYKRTNPCVQAYRYLQEAIAAVLPAPQASLIRPYLDLVIHSLQSHA